MILRNDGGRFARLVVEMAERVADEDHRGRVDDVLRRQAVVDELAHVLRQPRFQRVEQAEHRRPHPPSVGQDLGVDGIRARRDDRRGCIGGDVTGCTLRRGNSGLDCRHRGNPGGQREDLVHSLGRETGVEAHRSHIEEDGLVITLVADVESDTWAPANRCRATVRRSTSSGGPRARSAARGPSRWPQPRRRSTPA